jgi:hypothetical protein
MGLADGNRTITAAGSRESVLGGRAARCVGVDLHVWGILLLLRVCDGGEDIGRGGSRSAVAVELRLGLRLRIARWHGFSPWKVGHHIL